jgi:lipopolysaccharide export system protein LptC
VWRGLGFAAAATLAAFLLYQPTDTQAPDAAGNDEVIVNEPDVYGADIAFDQLLPDGSLHYRLEAEAIRQFDSEDLTRLVQPQLHLINAEQPPWDIASGHGYIRRHLDPDGNLEEVVYLRENVKLIQTHPVNGLVTLRSQALYIYPARQYAETDLDVMIDTDVGRTEAAGMKADLESGLLKLSSNDAQRVHTIVLPEQFKNS